MPAFQRNEQMPRVLRKPGGFTLLELVFIMLILAIIAVVAMANYFDMINDAETAAERGVVGGVRSGIQTYVAHNGSYPATLDSAIIDICSVSNPCFTTVLSQGGITHVWEKSGVNIYTGPTSTAYTYNPVTGVFQ